MQTAEQPLTSALYNDLASEWDEMNILDGMNWLETLQKEASGLGAMIDDSEDYIRGGWDSGTALFDTDNSIFPVQETCGVWQDVSDFEITHLEVAPDQLQTTNSAKHFDPSSSRNMIVTPP